MDAQGHRGAKLARLARAAQVQKEDIVSGFGEEVGRRPPLDVPREAILAEAVHEEEGTASAAHEPHGAPA